MQNVGKITFVILGALIGAGFISGQEINIFFNRYGICGILGIIISGAIIGISIKKTCNIIYETKINNYQEFIEQTIHIKNQYLKLIMNNLITIFLLISFFIMSAAFNNYFKQEFQIPIYITGIINALIFYFIFMKNSKAVMKTNEFLVPIILISIILLFTQTNTVLEYKLGVNTEIVPSILSGVIYASYNIVLLIPILITLNKYLKSKQQITIISIICAVVTTILAIIMYTIINTIDDVKGLEIPLIYIASTKGQIYYYIYGLVIIAAIFTTLISVGYGFLKNTTQKEKIYKSLAIIMGIASIIISYIGFSNLISVLYPLFGILGIIQIIFILIY